MSRRAVADANLDRDRPKHGALYLHALVLSLSAVLGIPFFLVLSLIHTLGMGHLMTNESRKEPVVRDRVRRSSKPRYCVQHNCLETTHSHSMLRSISDSALVVALADLFAGQLSACTKAVHPLQVIDFRT